MRVSRRSGRAARAQRGSGTIVALIVLAVISGASAIGVGAAQYLAVRQRAAVAADPNVDALVVIYIPPILSSLEEIAAAIADGVGMVPADKPVLCVFISSNRAPAQLHAGPRGRLPTFSFPENAAMALGAVERYGRWRRRRAGRRSTGAGRECGGRGSRRSRCPKPGLRRVRAGR